MRGIRNDSWYRPAAMGLVSMTASVPPELRDAFVALLPEGVSVNRALRQLIELRVHGSEFEVTADQRPDGGLDLTATRRPIATATARTRQPWTPYADNGGFLAEGTSDEPGSATSSRPTPASEVTATHSTVPDPSCVHPRGTLYRADHSVLCGVCGKVVR